MGVNVVTETLADGALEASRIVAWRWDAVDRRLDWSAGAEACLGLPDIVLRSPQLLARAIHPDDLPLVSAAVASALQQGAPIRARFRIVGSDGVRWLDCTGDAVADAGGSRVAVTGTLVDVTEEHEAEEAVLATLREAEAVLSGIGARLWEWDPATDALHALNTPVTGPHLFDPEPEGFSLPMALDRLDPDERGRVTETLREGASTGAPFSFETKLRDDEGMVHRAFVRGGRCPENGRVTGVCILLD